MIVAVSPRLAGPLAVAIAGLRRWYTPPDPQVRHDLAQLESAMRLAANEGHSGSGFDPAEIAGQARAMKPLLATFDAAAGSLSCSGSTIKRLVGAGELTAVGKGRGARITVSSMEAYVARASANSAEEMTA